MLEKSHDFKTIIKQPAHKHIIYKKVDRNIRLSQISSPIRRANCVSVSLEISRNLQEKHKTEKVGSNTPLFSMSRSPDPKHYLKPSKPRDWYSDFYKKIFEKEDYQKVLENQLQKIIRITSIGKKKQYAMSIDRKISKIQMEIAEEQNDKVYVTNKAMSNIQLLNGSDNTKFIAKNLGPIIFKPLKKMTLEPIGKKSPGMHRDKSMWMDNSKKNFREHIEQIVEKEKEVCDIIRNSLGNSYIKKTLIRDEFKRKEESFNGENIVFEKEYFNGLLEAQNFSESSSSFTEDFGLERDKIKDFN